MIIGMIIVAAFIVVLGTFAFDSRSKLAYQKVRATDLKKQLVELETEHVKYQKLAKDTSALQQQLRAAVESKEIGMRQAREQAEMDIKEAKQRTEEVRESLNTEVQKLQDQLNELQEAKAVALTEAEESHTLATQRLIESYGQKEDQHARKIELLSKQIESMQSDHEQLEQELEAFRKLEAEKLSHSESTKQKESEIGQLLTAAIMDFSAGDLGEGQMKVEKIIDSLSELEGNEGVDECGLNLVQVFLKPVVSSESASKAWQQTVEALSMFIKACK